MKARRSLIASKACGLCLIFRRAHKVGLSHATSDCAIFCCQRDRPSRPLKSFAPRVLASANNRTDLEVHQPCRRGVTRAMASALRHHRPGPLQCHPPTCPYRVLAFTRADGSLTADCKAPGGPLELIRPKVRV